jgi:hypothetical protein
MIKIIAKFLLATIFLLMLSYISFADQPPDPGGGPGGGDDPVGGGSPIGGGGIVMLVLSFYYGFRKIYLQREKLQG